MQWEDEAEETLKHWPLNICLLLDRQGVEITAHTDLETGGRTIKKGCREAAEETTKVLHNKLKVATKQQRVTIVLLVLEGAENPTDSPTRSVGEDNIALLLRPLYKGHTGVFLPVTHGLAEDCPLAAWKKNEQREWAQWSQNRNIFMCFSIKKNIKNTELNETGTKESITSEDAECVLKVFQF